MKVIHIAYDSREQKPVHGLKTHCSTDVRYHRQGLETFDYCVWRDWTETKGKLVQPAFAIERKSVADFIGAWFNKTNRQNEEEKIERARAWRPLPTIYVVEGSMRHIAAFDYSVFLNGGVTAKAVEARIDRLRMDDIHVVMAGSRYMAEYVIVSLLKKHVDRLRMGAKYWRELWADKQERSDVT